jgi:hypothetical protein
MATAQHTDDELGRFAGRTTMLLHGEEIVSIGDIQEGDRVAMDQGAGLQGVVKEVVREGSTGKKPNDGWGHKKVVVRTPSGGERKHLLYAEPEQLDHGDVAMWGLPGYSSRSGLTDVNVHKLLKIEE